MEELPDIDDKITDFFRRFDIEQARVEAMACVLLTVLAVRGIEVTNQDHDRILECFDSVSLSWWVVNASTATTAAEVFRPRLDAKDQSVRDAAAVAAGDAVLDARCSFAWRRAQYLARQVDGARTGKPRGHAGGGFPGRRAGSRPR